MSKKTLHLPIIYRETGVRVVETLEKAPDLNNHGIGRKKRLIELEGESRKRSRGINVFPGLFPGEISKTRLNNGTKRHLKLGGRGGKGGGGDRSGKAAERCSTINSQKENAYTHISSTASPCCLNHARKSTTRYLRTRPELKKPKSNCESVFLKTDEARASRVFKLGKGGLDQGHQGTDKRQVKLRGRSRRLR